MKRKVLQYILCYLLAVATLKSNGRKIAVFNFLRLAGNLFI